MYWKEQLHDAKPLPLGDFPRPAHPSSKGTRCAVVVPAEIIVELNRVAKEAKATLFSVLMSSFQVLLHLYTGHEDIAVGTACANRLRTEWEDLIVSSSSKFFYLFYAFFYIIAHSI